MQICISLLSFDLSLLDSQCTFGLSDRICGSPWLTKRAVWSNWKGPCEGLRTHMHRESTKTLTYTQKAYSLFNQGKCLRILAVAGAKYILYQFLASTQSLDSVFLSVCCGDYIPPGLFLGMIFKWSHIFLHSFCSVSCPRAQELLNLANEGSFSSLGQLFSHIWSRMYGQRLMTGIIGSER